MPVSMPSLGVKDILVEAGIGQWNDSGATADSWVINISRTSDDPDTMITLYDSPGMPPEPGLDIDYPSVQVVVRAGKNGYMAAWAKINQIRNELLGRPSETRNGDVWASVTVGIDIMHLGEDENARPSLAMTLNLIIHQGTSLPTHRMAT